MNEKLQFSYFAAVVDGEYTGSFGISFNMQPLIAGLNSAPVIVPITKEQAFSLNLGIIWDGKEFKLAEE